MNPPYVHQPQMDDIVMTPGNVRDCREFGLPQCTIENQDHYDSRDIRFDEELHKARDTCDLAGRTLNNVK